MKYNGYRFETPRMTVRYTKINKSKQGWQGRLARLLNCGWVIMNEGQDPWIGLQKVTEG